MMKRSICLILAIAMFALVFVGCAKEEDKPLMKLADVLAFADLARDVPIEFFTQYEYASLGTLYYFQLHETDYSFSIGMDSDGRIEHMMLSHISGEEIYLFHKNPGILDPNATPYTKDAKSYDIEKFIKEMSEE